MLIVLRILAFWHVKCCTYCETSYKRSLDIAAGLRNLVFTTVLFFKRYELPISNCTFADGSSGMQV
jgi:hypothetical protein